MSPSEELDTRIVGEETAAQVEGNEVDLREERTVDEATHEAESHVEQTRNYQEAEAIETAFTELVDNSVAVGESEIEATPIPLPVGPQIVEATPQPIPSPADEISATPITLPGQEKHEEVSNVAAVQSARDSESNMPVHGEPSVPLRELEGQLPEQEDLNQSYKAGQEFPGMDFRGNMPGGFPGGGGLPGGHSPGGIPGGEVPGMGGLPSDKGDFFGEDPLGNLFGEGDRPPLPGMQEDPAGQDLSGSLFGQGDSPFDRMAGDMGLGNDPFGTKGNSDGSPSLGGMGRGPGAGAQFQGGDKGSDKGGQGGQGNKGGKGSQGGGDNKGSQNNQGGKNDQGSKVVDAGSATYYTPKAVRQLEVDAMNAIADKNWEKAETTVATLDKIYDNGGDGNQGGVVWDGPKGPTKCTPEGGGGGGWDVPHSPDPSKLPVGNIDPVPPHLMRAQDQMAVPNPYGDTALTPDPESGGGGGAAIG